MAIFLARIEKRVKKKFLKKEFLNKKVKLKFGFNVNNLEKEKCELNFERFN